MAVPELVVLVIHVVLVLVLFFRHFRPDLLLTSRMTVIIIFFGAALFLFAVVLVLFAIPPSELLDSLIAIAARVFAVAGSVLIIPDLISFRSLSFCLNAAMVAVIPRVSIRHSVLVARFLGFYIVLLLCYALSNVLKL